MKLITEINEDLKVFELEEEGGKKSLFIEGIFLQSEIKNRNGRVYPKELLEREVERYTNKYIKENRAFGELGHPEGPTINLDRVSHMVTELSSDGNDWKGKAKVLKETPYGKIVQGILGEGARLGVSSRGMGSIEEMEDGTKLVKDDFYLATAADIVADPSAPGAFVQGIMEGKEWVWDNGLLQEKQIEEMQSKIEASSKRDREEVSILAFEEFINSL
tara:strand:+ start:14308 stop:14961 length:654 start_codon:yes stop_codon:yes gene_type:complete